MYGSDDGDGVVGTEKTVRERGGGRVPVCGTVRALLLPAMLVAVVITAGLVASAADAEEPACTAAVGNNAGGPAVQLASGHSMPLLGLGTWQATAGEVGHAVRAALRTGYRHIDCAAVYGNEREVGDALAEMVGDGPGQIPRSEVFVTSKLWNSEHSPRHVRPALEKTLGDLRLTYLDLYLVHWPQVFAHVEGSTTGRPVHANGSMVYDFATSTSATWAAMETLVTAGLARSIGLSNFNEQQIASLLPTAKIAPAVLQVESHPFFGQGALLEFCRSHHIIMEAYSPLASGGRTPPDLNNEPNVPGVQPAAGFSIVPHPQAQIHPVLLDIAQAHERSTAQVAIAWQIQRGVVVIPKSVKAKRVAQNFDVFFGLSEDEAKRIGNLDVGLRLGWGGPKEEGQPPRDAVHPLYPFSWAPSALK